MITWQESLSTQDERTDAQHRVLIDQFNLLEEIMTTKTGGEFRRAAGEVLDFLQFYAAWHFAEEEKVMDELHCPAAVENKRQHAEFLKLFSAFYTRWQTSTMSLDLARSTYHELSGWIVTHIQRVDVRLRDCR